MIEQDKGRCALAPGSLGPVYKVSLTCCWGNLFQYAERGEVMEIVANMAKFMDTVEDSIQIKKINDT